MEWIGLDWIGWCLLVFLFPRRGRCVSCFVKACHMHSLPLEFRLAFAFESPLVWIQSSRFNCLEELGWHTGNTRSRSRRHGKYFDSPAERVRAKTVEGDWFPLSALPVYIEEVAVLFLLCFVLPVFVFFGCGSCLVLCFFCCLVLCWFVLWHRNQILFLFQPKTLISRWESDTASSRRTPPRVSTVVIEWKYRATAC